MHAIWSVSPSTYVVLQSAYRCNSTFLYACVFTISTIYNKCTYLIVGVISPGRTLIRAAQLHSRLVFWTTHVKQICVCFIRFFYFLLARASDFYNPFTPFESLANWFNSYSYTAKQSISSVALASRTTFWSLFNMFFAAGYPFCIAILHESSLFTNK